MATDVLMPQLSPTMTEGRLSNWLKKEGDKVTVGMIIAEVETDKATMEVEAIEDGILAKTYATAGSDIAVGTPIAVIVEEGEKLPDDYKPTSKAAPKAEEKPAEKEAPKAAEKPVAEVKAAPAPAAPVAAPAPTASVTLPSGMKASPLARKLAAEWGVPLQAVSGTGPDGRIVRRDVEEARSRGVHAPVGAVGGVSSGFGLANNLKSELVPHSKMREVIATRLQAAKRDVPHFYLTVDVRMDALLEARKHLNAIAPKSADDKPAYKLTVNDFIIKACANAMARFPNANASWTDKGLQKYASVDVGVAVALDGGLITPIVKAAERKSLPAISAEMKELAARARAGKLTPDEYQGGSFSVSNLGMYGIKHFDAIVNPPQAAILACGATEERPVVVNGQLAVASIMTVTMSVDHRVIDGALGADVLNAIKQGLENPVLLTV